LLTIRITHVSLMNFDEPLSKVQFLKMFGKRVRPGDSQRRSASEYVFVGLVLPPQLTGAASGQGGLNPCFLALDSLSFPRAASFANGSEVPGNSRIKMEWDCKTG
jgi:hypothetical protein